MIPSIYNMKRECACGCVCVCVCTHVYICDVLFICVLRFIAAESKSKHIASAKIGNGDSLHLYASRAASLLICFEHAW